MYFISPAACWWGPDLSKQYTLVPKPLFCPLSARNSKLWSQKPSEIHNSHPQHPKHQPPAPQAPCFRSKMPHFLWAVRGAHFLRCSKSHHPYFSCSDNFPTWPPASVPTKNYGGSRAQTTWISHLFATKVTCKAASRARSFIAWIRKISESTCTIRFSQTQPTQPTKSSKNCCHTKMIHQSPGYTSRYEANTIDENGLFHLFLLGKSMSKTQVVWYTLLLQRWKLVDIARLQHIKFLAHQALESSSNLSLSSGTTQ